mmetsp:Transcript_9884/g.32376  ORF Transcript_9884/g.32376 Transcript_9884/m.32376 type:complete len:248 (+) Transcript_9884:837-1580(+)
MKRLTAITVLPPSKSDEAGEELVESVDVHAVDAGGEEVGEGALAVFAGGREEEVVVARGLEDAEDARRGDLDAAHAVERLPVPRGRGDRERDGARERRGAERERPQRRRHRRPRPHACGAAARRAQHPRHPLLLVLGRDLLHLLLLRLDQQHLDRARRAPQKYLEPLDRVLHPLLRVWNLNRRPLGRLDGDERVVGEARQALDVVRSNVQFGARLRVVQHALHTLLERLDVLVKLELLLVQALHLPL